MFTDIGEVDTIFAQEFNKCQAVFLETNYDKEMLWNGPYRDYIKKRVDSNKGHLSNEQALELIEKHASTDLHTIFPAHISDKNNTKEKVMQVLASLKGKYNIKLTSRQEISEVVRL